MHLFQRRASARLFRVFGLVRAVCSVNKIIAPSDKNFQAVRTASGDQPPQLRAVIKQVDHRPGQTESSSENRQSSPCWGLRWCVELKFGVSRALLWHLKLNRMSASSGLVSGSSGPILQYPNIKVSSLWFHISNAFRLS